MRGSLDHCVKCTICETQCPFSNATPLFPGPEVRRPAGRALPRRRRAVARRLARLLLELRHLHAGLPAGRAHRGDQHAGARPSCARSTGVPLRDQLLARPDPGRAARHARRAARELDARQQAAAPDSARRRSACTATRPCPSSRGATFQSGPARTSAAGRHAARRLLPRLRRELLRAAASREMAVALLEHNGYEVRCPSRAAAACRAVQRAVRRRARLRAPAWPRSSSPYARDGRRHRRHVDELLPDAQARGARDPRHGRRPDLRLVSERIFDICEYLRRPARARRAEARTSRPIRETVTYHAPCQQRGPRHRQAGARPVRPDPGADARSSCDAACCGVAGTYGLKKEKYAISMKVGAGPVRPDRRAPRRTSTRATPRRAAGRSQHATGVRSVHPVELLHRASGLRREGRPAWSAS